MKRLSADTRAGLAEDTRLLLAEGPWHPDQIIDILYHWYHRRVPKKSLRWRLARASAAYRREQKTWPAVTDCDRLDAAFTALEATGILARQNYCDCASDAGWEITREMRAELAAGREVGGYVFYHSQGTESAINGHGLHLSFGGPPDSPPAAAKRVGRRIVAALAAQGFKPEWDGNPDRCVFIPLVWQRRR